MTSQIFPGELQSVSEFRRMVATALADLPPEVVEGGRLVASELATNAVLHSRSRLEGGKYVGKIEIGIDAVLIEVQDEGDEPVALKVDPDLHGRGLIICAAHGQLSTEIAADGSRRTAVRIPLGGEG